MKPYYYVYEYGNKAPRVRHATLKQAETEAKRLAGTSPGTTFEVLMAVGITRVTTPQTFWMDGVTPPEYGPVTNREKGLVCGTCQVLALGATSIRCEREACPGRDLPNDNCADARK